MRKETEEMSTRGAGIGIVSKKRRHLRESSKWLTEGNRPDGTQSIQGGYRGTRWIKSAFHGKATSKGKKKTMEKSSLAKKKGPRVGSPVEQMRSSSEAGQKTSWVQKKKLPVEKSR